MSKTTRRSFLKTTGLGIAAGSLMARTYARAAGANERMRLALVGCGGRGTGVAMEFGQRPDCDLIALCDADSKRLADFAAKVSSSLDNPTPSTTDDMRRVFDDPNVDAVLVATPDHWHAPAAWLAVEAGKHVYVEKPCSHNVRQGRILVDSARRNKRVVQHGTQSRSMPIVRQGIQLLREGIIGDVLAAKAWNVQVRGNIGHAQPSDPPAELNYDLWVGPAKYQPYQSNLIPSGWHWFYNYGTGDMGNDGVHEIDYARWGLGVEGHPTRVSALGGKFFQDDDQQFPDTQQVAFEYPGDGAVGNKRMLIYEMRLWSTNYPYNVDNGAEFYGTKGRLMVTKRGKLEVYGERNKRIDVTPETADGALALHQQDFFDAIKTDRRPNADIEIGHISSTLCHLGNIATRLGRMLTFDPQTEQIVGDDEAAKLAEGVYREEGHWGIPKQA